MSGVSAAAVQVAVAAAAMAADVAVQASSMMGIQDRSRDRSRSRSRSSHVVSEVVSRRVENEAVVLDHQEQDQDDLILNSPPVLPTGRHSFVRSSAALCFVVCVQAGLSFAICMPHEPPERLVLA